MFVYAYALLNLVLLFTPVHVQSLVNIHGRDLNQPLLESYDYIVVGCGISGLVVTNRLSELFDRYVKRTTPCFAVCKSTILLPTSHQHVVFDIARHSLHLLTSIARRTVLCIEAGIPDHYESFIQDPVSVGSDLGGIYDWDLTTVAQTQLDGNTRPMPQGKVLGGGSILNAMCWNRGGTSISISLLWTLI